jgi:hypothetical protein
MGLEEKVFDWSQGAYAPDDIPDIPARAFRDAQGRVQLIASHYTNCRMSGPDLDHLTHDCGVIMPSHYDPDPAKFDDRGWLHSTYTWTARRYSRSSTTSTRGTRARAGAPVRTGAKCSIGDAADVEVVLVQEDELAANARTDGRRHGRRYGGALT